MALVEISSPAQQVVQITLNDPATRNAMSEQMAREFRECIETLAGDRNLRSVILTGAGEAFSAGGHLEMLFQKTKISREDNTTQMLSFYRSFLSVRKLPVPVIASINGHAIGAALGLALACDIRIVNRDAKLGLNFVRLGLYPGMGVTFFLPRLVGYARASELLYSGSIITGGEAAEIGLVNQALGGASVQEASLAIAKRIAASGPAAVRALRKSLTIADSVELEVALEKEATAQAESYASAEFLEGITAAREKRTPKFS